MVGGYVGAFICMTFTLPLAAFFGGGNDSFCFSATLAFSGIIAIILFIVAFKNLREVNVEKIKKIPVKDNVRAIKENWPWVILVTANLIFWIGLTIRQATIIYYCQISSRTRVLPPSCAGLWSTARRALTTEWSCSVCASTPRRPSPIVSQRIPSAASVYLRRRANA